jgi:hypothetical protein
MELFSLCARTTCDGLGGRSEIKRTHQLGLRRVCSSVRGLCDKKCCEKTIETLANFFYMRLEILHLRWSWLVSWFRPTAHAQRADNIERKRQFAKPCLSLSVWEKAMKLKAVCELRDILD